MTISYPLALPATLKPLSINMRAINAVARSVSPFTFAGNSYAYAGQTWQVDVALPPMKRSAAEVWLAWLVSLRG